MSGRFAREKKTVAAMVRIYCKAHHGTQRGLCEQCRELIEYADERLDRCRFGAGKPVCAQCPVHCYKTSMRERIREVMRFAGPRMLSRHPVLAIGHTIDRIKRPTMAAPSKTEDKVSEDTVGQPNRDQEPGGTVLSQGRNRPRRQRR